MTYVLFYILGYFLIRYFLYNYMIEEYSPHANFDSWIDPIIDSRRVDAELFFICLLFYPLGIPTLFLNIRYKNNKLPKLFKSGRQIIDSKKQKDLDKKELLRPIE